MKKLLLLILPLFLFCGNNYAKKPKLARSVWFLFEKQDGLEKQPNDSVVVSYKTVMKSCFPNDPEDGWIPQPHIVIIVQTLLSTKKWTIKNLSQIITVHLNQGVLCHFEN